MTRINIPKKQGNLVIVKRMIMVFHFPAIKPFKRESLYIEHESSPQSLRNTIEEKDITNKKSIGGLCILYRIKLQELQIMNQI